MSLKDASSPQQTSTVAGNFICYLGLKARLCCKVIVFFSKCCWFVQFALNSFLVGNVIHKQEVTPAMNEHSKPERGRLIARLSPPQWPLRGWVGGGGLRYSATVIIQLWLHPLVKPPQDQVQKCFDCMSINSAVTTTDSNMEMLCPYLSEDNVNTVSRVSSKAQMSSVPPLS